jgi:hypothetical protein
MKVVALEQFEFGHEMGSSHGESRMTRQAYSEGSMYVRGEKERMIEGKRRGKEKMGE